MLRDNTESFASEFTEILSKLGIKDGGMGEEGFQLLKFERVEPDVFVWLLRGNGNYIVTINDGGSDTPKPAWLATWSGGLTTSDLEVLVPENVNPAGYFGQKDGYDTVLVYRLPKEYDHCDHVDQYA